MEMNLLKNSKVCKIHIEKSSLAKTLEKVYGIEWGFSQETLDSYHHLRACVIKDITIEPGEILPVPTGMYLQLISPNYIVEVGTDHDVAYNEGLTIFSTLQCFFSYTFRNEMWMLIKNNFNKAQIIQPTKKLATFSVRQLPQMVINYVDAIEESNLNFRTSKKFIQEIKKKISPDIYDVEEKAFVRILFKRRYR